MLLGGMGTREVQSSVLGFCDARKHVCWVKGVLFMEIDFLVTVPSLAVPCTLHSTSHSFLPLFIHSFLQQLLSECLLWVLTEQRAEGWGDHPRPPSSSCWGPRTLN